VKDDVPIPVYIKTEKTDSDSGTDVSFVNAHTQHDTESVYEHGLDVGDHGVLLAADAKRGDRDTNTDAGLRASRSFADTVLEKYREYFFFCVFLLH
jgi:hypothetical protein